MWVFLVAGEFGIPTVDKPSETIRTLRRLFTAYNLLNRQIRMVKNAIQATLLDDGVVLTTSEHDRRFRGRESASPFLAERHLAAPILATVEIQVAQLCQTSELKERLATQIMVAGAPLAKQIELIVTIPLYPYYVDRFTTVSDGEVEVTAP